MLDQNETLSRYVTIYIHMIFMYLSETEHHKVYNMYTYILNDYTLLYLSHPDPTSVY